MAEPETNHARQISNPWLIAISVMLATFMEVLDTSIAAVALPYIAGSLSATTDEARWARPVYLGPNASSLRGPYKGRGAAPFNRFRRQFCWKAFLRKSGGWLWQYSRSE